MAEQWPV